MRTRLSGLVPVSSSTPARRWLALTAGLVLAGTGGAFVLRAQGGGPAQLPSQAADQAEAQFDGELEVVYEDSTRGARLHHSLRVGNERLTLQFATAPPSYENGTRVRARGRLSNRTLAISSDPNSIQVLALASSNTFGEQRVAVILVNFQDQVSTPYPWTWAHSTTFDTTSDFYRENSYGQTWITGNVFGWFTIPMSSTNCDHNQIASLADQAASQAGAHLSQYSRRVYAFPGTGSCGWWGLGTVGGNPSRAWVNGSYELKVVAHELGHNFGDYHSRSESCDAAGCAISEYGDDRDIMGGTSNGHMNAFQKERLGWLNYGSSPPIRTVTASGVYSLDPYAPAGSGSKALRILKSVDGSGKRTWYYLEARTQNGFDSGTAPGVIVHTGSEATGNSSNMFDLDRTTSAMDPVLDVGQTYTDTTRGLSFRTSVADALGAMVEVIMTGGPCSAVAPTVTVAPANMVTTSPGALVNYTVTVRNNDESTCGPATFDLAAAVPSGWSGTFNSSALTLAPGASSSASLAIVSAANASGQYAFQSSATRSGSGPSASLSTSILVAAALDVTLSVSASGGNSYQFSASVRAGGAPVSGAAVTFTMTDSSGTRKTFSATTSASGVATSKYRLKRGDPKGNYQVLAVVSKGSLSGSASSSFVVN